MAFRYGMGYAHALILVEVCASILAVSFANYTPISPANDTTTTTSFVVGGSEGWHFGLNYTDWAFRTSPFFLYDTLVFKYDPPNSTTHAHSVSLLPNHWSFRKCDLRKAKLVGNTTEGSGQGFQFVLKKSQPYYFVCGERAGLHCTQGLMKFSVLPEPVRRN